MLQTEKSFSETQPSIKIYDLMELFVETYYSTEAENSPPKPPKHEDTFNESAIKPEYEFDANSDIFQSLEISPIKGNSKSKDLSRQIKKSPLEDMKWQLIDYSQSYLVSQFVHSVLSEVVPDTGLLEQLQPVVVNWINEKVKSLIEAVCDCDKRKWMDELETESMDSLRYVESLQKELRQIQRRRTPMTQGETQQLCTTILNAPEFKEHVFNIIEQLV